LGLGAYVSDGSIIDIYTNSPHQLNPHTISTSTRMISQGTPYLGMVTGEVDWE